MKIREIGGKPIGQIAYDAYRDFSSGISLVSGAVLPTWEVQAGAIKNAWNASAQAVLNANTLEEDGKL